MTHPACMESLPALLDFAEAECKRLRADVSTAFAIKLAVEEACVNVIQHGYPPDAAGPIVLSIRADSSCFVVTLADRAVPFLPEDAPPPDLSADWAARRAGGLGWHLIKQIMDQVEYQRDPGGENRLILIKYRTQADLKESNRGDQND